MRFTKYNNPARKRRARRKDYNAQQIEAAKAALLDWKNRYDVPASVYFDTDDIKAALNAEYGKDSNR